VGLNHPLDSGKGYPVLFARNKRSRLDTAGGPVETKAGQKNNSRHEYLGGSSIHGATALLGEVNQPSFHPV